MAPRFPEIASRYVAFCHIDSKVAGRKHADLRQQKKLLALPSLAFLDAEGTVLVKLPHHQRTVDELLAAGARAEEYVRLRASVAADDRAARAPFLLMQLEEGQLELAAARALRERIADLPDDRLRATIDARIVDLQIGTDLSTAGQGGRPTLGPRFLELMRKGPKPSVHVSRGFYYAMLEWAERKPDPAAFREALTEMARVLAITDPGKAWVEPSLAGYRAKLEALERAERGR